MCTKKSTLPYEYSKPIDKADLLTPESMSSWVGRSKIKYQLSMQGLEDIIISNSLPHQEVRVFACIGKKVLYLNRSYVMIEQLGEELKLSKANIRKSIKTLESSLLIKEIARNTFGVGSRVIDVNPIMFWKGNYALRWIYWHMWCKMSYKDESERLYACPLKEIHNG